MRAGTLKWMTATFAGLLMASAVIAEEPRQPAYGEGRQLNPAQPTTEPRTTGAQQMTGSNHDALLAGCLIVDNEGEIALGKLAEERAKDNDVKNFAKQMVEQHTQFLQKLQQFAGRESRGGAAASAGEVNPPTGATAATPIAGQHGGLNLVDLKQKIGQRKLQLIRGDLEKKNGADFDRCYVGQQIGAHIEVLAALETFKDIASPELRKTLEEGISTTEAHLKQAKQLDDNIGRRSTEQASRETERR
jgi:predicted outer membrane protein